VSSETASDTVRVVIADEHAVTRAGVALALAGHGFDVVAETASADAAVEAVLQERPELCLLDAGMADRAIAAAARIHAGAPETAVVMLAGTVEDDTLFASLAAGARGYLLKDMDAGRLPHALHGVLAGEAAMPRALMSRVLEEFPGRRRRRAGQGVGPHGVMLTEREWEVADLMREGMSTRAIAERLAVSPVTVRRHISALLAKLEAGSREEIVRLVEASESGD